MTMRFLAQFWPVRLTRPRSDIRVAIEEAAEIATRLAGVPNFRRSLPDLARELARARRYGRPASLAVLSLGGHWSDETGFRNGGSASESSATSRTSQVAIFAFGSVLQEVLRESDLVTYGAARNQYVILLTESTKEQAHKVVERLSTLYYQRTLDRLRAGIAEFPSDALTLAELVVSAQRTWQEQPIWQYSQQAKGKPNGHTAG